MDARTTVLPTLLLTLLSTRAASAEPLEIPHRGGELVVDGDLTDWEGVAPATGGGQQGDAPVRLSLAWDAQTLYAAVVVEDEDVVAGEPGDDPWAVDRIELAIEPDGDGATLGEGDLRVLVGCNGSVAVHRAARPSADGRVVMAGTGPVAGLRAAARRRPGGYDVELAVPTSLALSAEGATGRVLAVDLLRTDLLPSGPGEPSLAARSWAWSDAEGGKPPQVVLAGAPPLLQRAGQGASSWLLTLLASLLAASSTAVFFLILQRRKLARFHALARRLEELEREPGGRPTGKTRSVPVPGATAPPREPTAPRAELGAEAPPPAAPPQDSATDDVPPVAPSPKGTVDPYDPSARELVARIAEVEQQECAEEPVGVPEGRALAEQTLAWVLQHLSANPSVADLAKAMHVTPRTLQRGLQRSLECTPRELLLTVRMREAKRLLKTGAYRVSEAAYEVGFEDPAHFSRRFKAYYGCTPSELVEHYRGVTEPRDPGAL
jgi:AraC-like DNA-binding protein